VRWGVIGIVGVLGVGAVVAYKRFAPFSYSITPLSEADRRRMTGVTWRQGCPVGLDNLVILTVRHRTYSGLSRLGKLVVNATVAESLSAVFRNLYDRGFPIQRMRPMSKYAGNDNASMRSNNTSAFNCRKVAGSDSWSEHSMGTAVDINPLVNPYVSASGAVQPSEGAIYADRSVAAQGTITPEIAAALGQYGWRWGGDWSRTKDYQHFSTSGR